MKFWKFIIKILFTYFTIHQLKPSLLYLYHENDQEMINHAKLYSNHAKQLFERFSNIEIIPVNSRITLQSSYEKILVIISCHGNKSNLCGYDLNFWKKFFTNSNFDSKTKIGILTDACDSGNFFAALNLNHKFEFLITGTPKTEQNDHKDHVHIDSSHTEDLDTLLIGLNFDYIFTSIGHDVLIDTFYAPNYEKMKNNSKFSTLHEVIKNSNPETQIIEYDVYRKKSFQNSKELNILFCEEDPTEGCSKDVVHTGLYIQKGWKILAQDWGLNINLTEVNQFKIYRYKISYLFWLMIHGALNFIDSNLITLNFSYIGKLLDSNILWILILILFQFGLKVCLKSLLHKEKDAMKKINLIV
jgi:hypothetical protein